MKSDSYGSNDALIKLKETLRKYEVNVANLPAQSLAQKSD